MKYREDIWDKLIELKERLVYSCNLCNGEGGTIDRGICKCMTIFKYVSKLMIAGIPIEYWHLSIESLEVIDAYKLLVKSFIDHMDNAVRESLGIAFLGHNGVGKTAMINEIGKWGIVKGYSVKYFTTEQYILALQNNNMDLVEEYTSAQIQLFDELGKSYMKEGSSYVPTKIEDFIRRTVSHKVLICGTNFDSSQLSEILGESSLSVMKRHLKFVEVEGSDFSDKLHSTWKMRLEKGYDYNHRNIVTMAELKEKLWEEQQRK